MAVQRAVAERWKEVTGVPIVKATDSPRRRRSRSPTPSASRTGPGTIGVPIPSTEAAVLDDTGIEVPVGQVGEICIRGRR